MRSVRVAERLALPTSVHGVAGSNPAGGAILPEPKRRFIAQSLSCSSFHRFEMTEIVLKGRKTLTHPSIHPIVLLNVTPTVSLVLLESVYPDSRNVTQNKLKIVQSEVALIFIFRFSLFVFRFSFFIFRYSNCVGKLCFDIQNPILTFELNRNILF